MRAGILVLVAAVLLVAGLILYPLPDRRIAAADIVSKALGARQPSTVPVAEMRRRLRLGCIPILEGSDQIAGAEVWAVRLKIPPPKKYPWIEMWIDKRTNRIHAWKEWGRREGRVQVLAQYPDPR